MKTDTKTRRLFSLAAAIMAAASLHAAPVIYEPFADNDATLTGNTPTAPATGLTGTWTTAGLSWNVAGPTFTFGALPTTGNYAASVAAGARGSHSITTGTVASNTLKNAGLLEHGATVWFSFLWKMDAGTVSNAEAAFTFGTDRLVGGSANAFMPLEATNGGFGIGVSLNSTSTTPLTANTWAGGPRTTAGAAVAWDRTVPRLLVGRIVWGADATKPDSIFVYVPATDLILPAAVSTTSAVLNQANFNTISFGSKAEGDPQIDEIRFGATYLDVIGAASTVATYWDVNTTTAGAGTPTVEAWDGVSNLWNSDATGGGAGSFTATTAGLTGVFAAGSDATGTYSVPVTGTPSIGGLSFEEGTVTVSGGTALDLVPAGGALEVRQATGTAIISTPISQSSGSGALYKEGGGTLTLSGNNTYGSTTIVNAGKLILSGDNNGALGAMTLNSGITQFDSTLAIPGLLRSVTVNANSVAMFGSTLTSADITTGLGRIATASAGVIAADNNDADNFDLSAFTAAYFGAVGTVDYTGAITPNLLAYRLGGGGGALTITGANKINNSGGSRTLTVQGPGTVTLANSNNYSATTTINSGGTLTLAASNSATTTTINGGGTLVVGNAASIGGAGITLNGALVIGSPTPFNLGANQLFFSTGASVRSDSTTARSIAGRLNGNANNTIILGNATNNGKLTFTVASTFSSSVTTYQCESEVEFSAGFTTAAGGGVTKTGPATLIFSAANLFTGNNAINAGTMRITNATALGYGGPQTSTQGSTTVASGATLDLAGSTGVNEPITLNGTGVGTNGALVNSSTAASIGNGVAGVTVSASGVGSGYGAAPAVTFAGGGGSGAAATATSRGVTAASFTITSGTTTYSVKPTVTISGGGGTGATATSNLTAGVVTSITITAAGTGFTSAPTIVFSAGTVLVAGTNPTGAGNATNFCVSGITMTAAGSGYTSAPTMELAAIAVAATVNLTTVALNAASSIGGSGDITIDAVVSGAGANTLTKVGANTLTLNGANTYSGATAVNGGKLQVATGSGTRSASAVTVANTVNCIFGVKLAAVNGQWASTSSLTVAGSSSQIEVDYDGTAPSISTSEDPIKVTDLTISGAGTLKVLGITPSTPNGTYPLINFTGTGPAAADPYTGLTLSLPGGVTGKLTTTANHVNLVIEGGSTYTVTYDDNVSTGGSVPVDAATYATAATVTVLGNTGSLVKTGFVFTGWNTQADGLGTHYNPAATFPMGSANVTLFAEWKTPYQVWATGDEAFDGDANGDGVQDGIAFLLGAATPGTDASELLPTVSESGGDLILTFDCLPIAARGGSSLKVAYSNTLASFTAATNVVPNATGADAGGVVSYVVTGPSGSPSVYNVVATIDSSAAGGGKLFGRLQGTE